MFIIAVCKEVCKCQNWWNKLLFLLFFCFCHLIFFCWFVGICIKMTIGIDSCEIIRIEIYLNNSWRYFWSKAIQEKPISCWNICEKKYLTREKNSFTVFRFSKCHSEPKQTFTTSHPQLYHRASYMRTLWLHWWNRNKRVTEYCICFSHSIATATSSDSYTLIVFTRSVIFVSS